MALNNTHTFHVFHARNFYHYVAFDGDPNVPVHAQSVSSLPILMEIKSSSNYAHHDLRNYDKRSLPQELTFPESRALTDEEMKKLDADTPTSDDLEAMLQAS